MYATASPLDWDLPPATADRDAPVRTHLGISYPELEERCRKAVYEFVLGCYDDAVGALHHYYRADTGEMSEMDSGNFLMALNFVAMYDRYGDGQMLERAERCYRWAYDNCTETHPMFSWQGGVRDQFTPTELYTKYTADALTTCAALHRRNPRDEYLHEAAQYHNFLKQARQAGFMAKYHRDRYEWADHGFSWNTFGAPAIAYLELHAATGDDRYREHARAWVDHGLSLQADDGSFYLLDGQFWNSDLAPLELRALVFTHELTGEQRYLDAASRFTDWLLDHQRDDGAWPIGIDRDGEVVAPNVGPGDMPNIAISLLRLHQHTADPRHLEAATLACRYALAMQAVPDGRYPLHLDDPHVRWGFWSWDPIYDHSLSGDQVVHHVRGLLLTADYLAATEGP